MLKCLSENGGKIELENQGMFFDYLMKSLTSGQSKLPTFARTTVFVYLERVGRLKPPRRIADMAAPNSLDLGQINSIVFA